MESNGKLSADQAKQLADELSALSQQQSSALQTGAYISMSREEAKAYDLRRVRITKICALLGQFKPEQNAIESCQDTDIKGTNDDRGREQTP